VGFLTSFPNNHFIHPRVFVDLGGKREEGRGKREWDPSTLGLKLIQLYEEATVEIPDNLQDLYQLLIFLWAQTKQCGNSVTLREILEIGEVTSLCKRKR
jgi:hypothetical protein